MPGEERIRAQLEGRNSLLTGQEFSPHRQSQVCGSTVEPSTSTMKCRWHPVE